MSKRVMMGLLATVCAACAPAPTVLAQSGDVAAADCEQRLTGSVRSFAIEHRTDDGRAIPFTAFAPEEPGSYPLIAFSHGAFATPERYSAMLEPLAAAGFVVLAPMHIDSEEYPRQEGEPERPPHPITWATRTADMDLALDPPADVRAALSQRGLALAEGKVISAGHSYGALIAQLFGGARAVEPDGSQIDRRDAEVDAVIAFSPPGAMPGLMAEEGWATLAAPALTITGTADVLPGFIDDWHAHLASHERAPEGNRALWVGEGIDHYFGGSFGRIDDVDESEQRLFSRALARSLAFMDKHVREEANRCTVIGSLPGERYEEDDAA